MKLVFDDPVDYDKLEMGDLVKQMQTKVVEVRDNIRGITFKARLELSESIQKAAARLQKNPSSLPGHRRG